MRTKILIVGAGPTGLMLACQLSRFNVDFQIIDKKSGTTTRSKALGVQARSMEIYDQLGLIDKAFAQGKIADGAWFFAKGKIAGQLPLGRFGQGLSPFPYLFILEQSKNEALLEGYLNENGRTVLWDTSFESYIEDDSGVHVSITDKEGHKVIHADYIVGADGAHSPVRKLSKIPFLGGTYEDLFLVADAKIEWNLPYDKLCVMMERDSFGAFFPMPEEKRVRIISIVPDELEESNASFDKIAAYLNDRLSVPMSFSDVKWFATYKVHYKYVSQFNKGRIFLCGDAAHIHSPAGGQGMNTGLQDATNLAWKFAAVCKNGLDAQLLKTYDTERQPNAVQLIKTTDRGFQLIGGNKRWQRFVRTKLLPLVAGRVFSSDRIRRRIFKRISQIEIHYRRSILSKGKLGGFVAGDRLPYFELSETMHSLMLTASPGFHILCWKIHDISTLKTIIENKPMLGHAKVHDLSSFPLTSKSLDSLGVKNSLFCMVRPDQHIGYVAATIKVKDIESYLSNY